MSWVVPKISMSQFYEFGAYCFGIIAIMNLINFMIFFNNHNWYSGTAAIADIIFKIVLVWLFLYLKQTSNGQESDFENLDENTKNYLNNVMNGGLEDGKDKN